MKGEKTPPALLAMLFLVLILPWVQSAKLCRDTINANNCPSLPYETCSELCYNMYLERTIWTMCGCNPFFKDYCDCIWDCSYEGQQQIPAQHHQQINKTI
ncbi:hypothetical protein ACJIZ3_002972 [Penstemon smallii]|uniref:Uncharacterized protein n=1 Tax=Penstemon smallii TaxID=265156 RepID=A0ABD3U7X7_9LAMI